MFTSNPNTTISQNGKTTFFFDGFLPEVRSGCWAALARKCRGSERLGRWWAPPSSHSAAF